MIRSLICGTFVLFLVLVIASQPGSAQPPGGHLNITEVIVDFDTQTMIIMGEDLAFGGSPDITLGDFGSLNLITESPTLIVVDFPEGGLPDGDYLLTVSRGEGQSQNDEYDLTIGAVGPEGPEGPIGLTGDTGAIGPEGPIGLTGATGDIGPIGLTGLTGPEGVPGLDGLAGADGISCWDLDGDGINDAEEDINGDGFFDTLDCIGADGADGADGAAGPAGLSEQIIGGGAKKVNNSSDRYMGMYTYADDEPTEFLILQVMPIMGAVTDLYVLSSNTDVFSSFTITVRKDGGDTALTCSLATTDCNDLTHCADYAVGDTISVEVVPVSDPDNNLPMSWTAIFHPGTTCAILFP